MRLAWHTYRYYPYERMLAIREAAALLNGSVLSNVASGIILTDSAPLDQVRRLTYFSGVRKGRSFRRTSQAELEAAASASRNRQSTRYSVHGLHEYKGKFNPQVAKALLNIFGVRSGDCAFDPFCGSGTTLVECSHIGVQSVGVDPNPLAVFVANAKLLALATGASVWRQLHRGLSQNLRARRIWNVRSPSTDRIEYLAAWFDLGVLRTIEVIKAEITAVAGERADVFLAIASNLLRDYSLQDPHDLRIRRRKSPLPSTPFVDAFLEASEKFVQKIAKAQAILGVVPQTGTALLHDARTFDSKAFPGLFDAAITSPPYAMALPYIDTQRLSLVWLGLLPPSEVLALEAALIGSREIRGSRGEIGEQLITNASNLPETDAAFCLKLQSSLRDADGFRRRAVPVLLYRYLAAMRDAFASIQAVLKPGAPFGLIVGRNHTILGGVRYEINTPAHLASVAESVGWKVEAILDLQTYQRYGYHMANAVGAESLMMLSSTGK